MASGAEALVADEAARDLEEAVFYVGEVLGEPTAAAELLALFDEFLSNVEQFPELYPLCGDAFLAMQGFRHADMKGYSAVYFAEPGVVHVVGFFRQTQDCARLV